METVAMPIDGVLDLHTFAPRELDNLIVDYIEACLESGIYDLRIIHGKGKGILRGRVRRLLANNLLVKSFTDAPNNAGGWGATVVELKRT